MKIQNKIIYLLLVIFVSYTLIFSGFIYYSISNYAFTDFYKRLEIRAITTAKYQLEEASEVDVIRDLRHEYLEKLQEEEIYLYKITNNAAWRTDSLNKRYKKFFIDNVLEQGIGQYYDDKRYYYGTLYETANQEKYLVVASAENYFISHHIIYLRNLLITSLVIGFIIIFFISFFVFKENYSAYSRNNQ
ncbi:hypothetical protein LVD15_23505 [Fulvivirga maritima]|uniref:hypothetical protein n=1 Tax=Fulvivirga maritima TaxID=2904247 RepID=UPI001F1F365F|nr:hypothetical protein [Fulvivirga maritima]UII26231.1 hypothetical protein LVD15_23505 [Fulvivirga maritima]